MAYSTKLDLQRIVQSSDITSLSQKSELNITKAITDADDLINLELGGIYTIPLNPIDDIVVRISAMLAVYFLYQTKLNLAEFNNEGAYRVFYKDAMEWLKKIRTQEVSLNSVLLNSATAPTIFVSKTTAKVYTDICLGKF